MDVNRGYLCAPKYVHGELRPIESIGELQEDPDLLQNLKAVGLERFSVATEPVEDALARCADAVLKSVDVDPDRIGAVVLASTFYCLGPDNYKQDMAGRWLSELARRLKLSRAVPYGVSFMQCVNVVAAMELAQWILSGGDVSDVLVVTADRIHETRSRVLDPGISVISDVSSAFLVSSMARGDQCFRMGAVRRHADWDLINIRPSENFPEFLRRTAAGMKAVADAVQQVENVRADDFDQLITNTVNNSVVRIFGHATGIPTQKVYRGNVARLGHCDVADTVVNLADFCSDANAVGKDRLLLVGNAPYMWGGLMMVRA